MITICPACKANLDTTPIPQKYLDAGYYQEGITYYTRLMGLYCLKKDRTMGWKCPDCGYEASTRKEFEKEE